MYSRAQTIGGVLLYSQKLHLTVSGATVEVTVEIVDNVVPTGVANATTSSGIDISANGWNLAACSIGTDLDVWLYRHDGVIYTGQSAGHGVTLGANQVRHSVGGEWPGANYMDGEIAHACAWTDIIDAKVPEAMAYGMSPPMVSGNTGGSDLIYWLTLLDDDYQGHFGELTGGRAGEKIELDPQNTPSVGEHNPAMAPIMGAFM
jgi:hypothetical protein